MIFLSDNSESLYILIKIMRNIKIFFKFFKNIAAISGITFIISIILFFKYGYSVISPIIILKLITFLLTFYIIDSSFKKKYFYFENLGFTKYLLWGITALIDFLILFISLFILSLFK